MTEEVEHEFKNRTQFRVEGKILKNDEQEVPQDWSDDEKKLLLASELIHSVRQRIFDELGYTCSAGIANNLMLSKVASNANKPNGQTIIFERFLP